jgi:thiol:disulfide interchange protein DsbC
MKNAERTCATIALTLAALLPATALAGPDQDKLLRELQQAHPGTRFTAVSPTPVADLYEVWMGPNVAYVSSRDLRYLLFGHLWDSRAMQDLTAQKLSRAQVAPPTDEPRIDVAALPLADAIRSVRGSGRRQLVLFSDPGCPHCKRLEAQLASIDDVTIHTFVVPFQGTALPLAILCAGDPARAWRDYMRHADESKLARGRSCRHPLQRNVTLARQLGVSGTPTLIFADGQRSAGYLDADQIEARLRAAVSAAGKPQGGPP